MTPDGKERVTWRTDLKCESLLNSLGSPATCENPSSNRNCCKDFYCVNDLDCEQGTLYTSLAQISHFKNQYSVHRGFVNLTPLVFGLIPKEQLSPTLKMIENELLSEFGIRSLSDKDQFYHQESDYYRGDIFIWQNYLVLRGLYLYYSDCPDA